MSLTLNSWLWEFSLTVNLFLISVEKVLGKNETPEITK